MSIALYDADRIYALKNKKPIPPPNFQLMKLSTYLNRQREMVSFISDLSRAPYYEKIYYFQEDISIPFASPNLVNPKLLITVATSAFLLSVPFFFI